MRIKDKCGIIEKMITLANKESEQEHGAFAVGKALETGNLKKYILFDYCMIEEIGGEEQESHVKIPAKLSHVLIQTCKKEGNLPVILHTHKPYLGKSISFSPPDIKFMEQFSLHARKNGNISDCLFIVTDGISIAYCLWDLTDMCYTLEKEELRTDDERERIYCCL